MKLDEAKKLRDKIEHQSEIGLTKNYENYDVPDPEKVYIVSEDGLDFGVIFFTGSYDDYTEAIVYDEERWNHYSMLWKQRLFNGDGEWANRKVTILSPVNENFGFATLNCGHQISFHHRKDSNKVQCFKCQESGRGWLDQYLEESNKDGWE